MKKMLAGLVLVSWCMVAYAEYVFQSSKEYTAATSLAVTNAAGGQVQVSSIGIEWNVSFPATVTVSRVRGGVTNVIKKYESSTDVQFVGFPQSDLQGYVFVKDDILTVVNNAATGTNCTITVDLYRAVGP
jgi:hypothetical protein